MTHHRRDQAARDGNRDPDVGTVMLEHAAFGPGGVGVRHALQRERERLDDKVVDRELVGGLAVLVLGCDGVDLLARGEAKMRLAPLLGAADGAAVGADPEEGLAAGSAFAAGGAGVAAGAAADLAVGAAPFPAAAAADAADAAVLGSSPSCASTAMS